jgi:hypothetical protein
VIDLDVERLMRGESNFSKQERKTMTITIESTPHITTDPIEGKPCRVWNGVTGGGTECILFVRLIAVSKDQDARQFERELLEQMPPGQAKHLRT